MVEADPLCFVYQTPTGIDAICAAHNAIDESRLYELPDGRRLLLPLHRPRRLPAFLSSVRTPKIGGLLASDTLRSTDIEMILSDLQDLPFLRKLVRPTALQAEQWIDAAPPNATRKECYSHVIDLDGGFARVWQEKFNSQARRGVRKAEKAGLQIEQGNAQTLLTPMYGLIERSIERWAADRGEPLLLARWRAQRSNSLDKLRRTFGTFGDSCRIWMASIDAQPAAAIIVLFGRNAHYTRGAMDKELSGPTRASFLLQKLAIEEACARGCRYYSMGETGTSTSLARFKEHFGASSYRYPEYRYERIPFTQWEARMRRLAKFVIGPRRTPE